MARQSFPSANRPSKKRTGPATVNLEDSDSPDDYLAAGVKQEEAGEKWRAGDAAKASRFFQRALETYERGLRHFPRSFDLLYNKARLQYSITQHPAVATQFPGQLRNLLDQSLRGHRQAITLVPDNADALFNTAQVLTSLAEAGGLQHDIAQLYHEALELFDQCLQLQEKMLLESQQIHRMAELSINEDPPVDSQQPATPTTDATTTSLEEQWAAILEPVTPQTLIDTLLAAIDALTALAALPQISRPEATYRSHEYLEQLSSTLFSKLVIYVDALANQKDDIPDNSTVITARADAILARARCSASLAEGAFRASSIDATLYHDHVTVAFDTDDVPFLQSTPHYTSYLLAYADVLTTLNHALSHTRNPIGNGSADVNFRWTSLSKALDLLTLASKQPQSLISTQSHNVAAIHTSRGDTELLRLTLLCTPTGHGYSDLLDARLPPNSSSVSSGLKQDTPQIRTTLLKNAATYYRGAVALAKSQEQARSSSGMRGQGSLSIGMSSQKEGEGDSVLVEAQVKLALVECLRVADAGPLLALVNNGSVRKESVKGVIRDVGDGREEGEGLVREVVLERMFVETLL